MAQYVSPVGPSSLLPKELGAQRGPEVKTAAKHSKAQRAGVQPKKPFQHIPVTPLSPLGCLSRRKGTPTEFCRGGVTGVWWKGASRDRGRGGAWGLPPTLDIPPRPCSERRLLQTLGKSRRFVMASLRACPRGRPETGALRLAWGLPPTRRPVRGYSHYKTEKQQKQQNNRHYKINRKTQNGKQQKL
jgi:hypothetical protein